MQVSTQWRIIRQFFWSIFQNNKNCLPNFTFPLLLVISEVSQSIANVLRGYLE